MRTFSFLLGLVAAAAVSVGSASAGIINGVAVYTNMGYINQYDHHISHIVDHSGLSTPVSLTSTHSTAYQQMWLSSRDRRTGYVRFELDDIYVIDSIAIWQYQGTDSGFGTNAVLLGVKDFKLEYSLDNVTYTEFYTGSLAKGDGQVSGPYALLENLNITAKHIRMQILGNHGTATSAPYTGLAEVAFSGTPVPEPGALASLVGASGLLLRRKKRQAKPAA